MQRINFQTGLPWFPLAMVAVCAALFVYVKIRGKTNLTTSKKTIERRTARAQKIERDVGA
jgi:hypothetical protein